MTRFICLSILYSLLTAFGGLFQKDMSMVAQNTDARGDASGVSLIILGNVQDAGSPHIGCTKDCCKDLFENPDKTRKAAALGLIDAKNNLKFLFEATPDIPAQMKILKKAAGADSKEAPDAILVTHAHIGHYAGLMFLGKEAMDARDVPVYAMPKMKNFLENNQPWKQLITRKNIVVREMSNNADVELSANVRVTPFLVPHRDEISETVGFIIAGPRKKALFIPDIDKWNKWDRNIVEEIKKVDYALIDGTFFSGKELNFRDISQIPHPFIIESMTAFSGLSAAEKNKIIFIHLNHTNPALKADSPETEEILKQGFRVARFLDVLDL